MRTNLALRLALVLTFSTASHSLAESPWQPSEGVRAVVVAEGFDRPVYVGVAPGDPRLFVVEQSGRIRWIEDGRPSREPFADLTGLLRAGGERGLLGLAFHPDYARNGLLYVNYTDRDGDTQVVRYTVRADRRAVDPASAKTVITVDQPFPNHNGGGIAFGPDGMLYIGMGDGGAGGDPIGHGQNARSRLGKLLRIDVDRGDPYAIPDGNPYKGRPSDGAAEVWALGLRNPWRWAFDPEGRRLVIADVGQNRYEEVNVVDDRRAGLNYGWNVREGRHGFGLPRPAPANLVEPAVEYDHDDGCSVTGGIVYRGRAIPALRGAILFSDYCIGWLRSFRHENGRALDLREWRIPSLGAVTSFGEDAAREPYVVAHDGRIWKLVPAEPRERKPRR